MPGQAPAAEYRLQRGSEKSPLLGSKADAKKSRCSCFGGGPFAISSIVIVVVLLICSGLGVYRRFLQDWGSESMAKKGHNYFDKSERFLIPALPSQAPPRNAPMKPGLPLWPEKQRVDEHGPHEVVVPAASERSSEPPAKIQSGSLQAHIRYKTHPPSWHSLVDTRDFTAVDVDSRPLFILLSHTTSKEGVTSKDCHVVHHDQSDERLQLRLSCPLNIEATFDIHGPSQEVDAGYLRITFELWTKSAPWPTHLSTLRLLDALVTPSTRIALTGARGEQGLPVVVGDRFFVGGEHPMAITAPFHESHGKKGVFVDIRHLRSLRPPTEETPWRFGAVVGVIPEKSQARRAFVNYIHNERPGRRTPMVHYNSWFDFTGWQDGFNKGVANMTDTMSEASCIERVRGFGENLVRKHGVEVNSFLIDDGWDNTNTLWEFDHQKFPRGLTKVADVAHEYGSGVGIWLSPWGGYGDPKNNRVREGKARGFETKMDAWNEEAFDLAGKKYGAWFLKTAEMMRHDQGVNMFKFDGTSRVPQEMEAMLGMVGEVRKVKVNKRNQDENDEVWISLTTGTWPSPFFLFWADNIWRGDGDVGPYPGKEIQDGLSQRQKWIRWRAEKVQQHIVDQSAFFPLSQLMIHGVVLAGHGDALYTGLGESTDVEFAQEIWSFVGMGLQLQELYISPSRMTASMWALLAEGLTWSSQNVKVLMDTHWAFGRVDDRQVFCMASWDPQQEYGFVMLQNGKGDKQGSSAFKFGSVLELPRDQAHKFLEVSIVKSAPGRLTGWGQKTISKRLHACHGASQACRIGANATTHITLEHTEVLLLEVRLA